MELQPESNGQVTDQAEPAESAPIRDIVPLPPEARLPDVVQLPIEPFAAADVMLQKVRDGQAVEQIVIPAAAVNALADGLRSGAYLFATFHMTPSGGVALKWETRGFPKEQLLECVKLLIDETRKM